MDWSEHRDHLARLFNTQAAAGTRKVEFGKILNTQKREFFQGLARMDAPVLAVLKQGQDAQLVGLRQRFDQAREAQKFRATSVVTSREASAKERSDMFSRQRSERAATKARHAEETAGQQQAWADLNKARSETWGQYKALRARQVTAQKARAAEPSQDVGSPSRGTVGDYADSRKVQGRDYGRANDAGPTRGDGGLAITRKGPSGS